MFPDVPDGEPIAEGWVGFCTAGLYAYYDTEYLKTDDDFIWPHNTLFLGLVHKRVQICKQAGKLVVKQIKLPEDPTT